MGVIFFIQPQAQVQSIEYDRKIEDGKVHLSIKNLLPAPLNIVFDCDTVNQHIDTLLVANSDFVKILEAPNFLENDSASLMPFIKIRAFIGDKNAKPVDFEYALPFASKCQYKLIQGFNGKFSHESRKSKYALDFAMKVGEPVHAAREGIVCYYQNEFKEGGRDRDFTNKANRILILHEDGTIGYYNHLMFDGVVVELGEEVEQGQLIGYSGNTGYSTQPHLHFVVRVAEESVPFRIEGIRKLKKGKVYGRRK